MMQPTQNPTQPNSALVPYHKFVAYGDWLAQAITVALARRLRHQNVDGTWYSPRVQTVVAALSNPPFYYAVLDDHALFHFPRAMLINEHTRDALAAVLHYPVFAFLPEQCEDLRDALRQQGAILPYGVTYAIPLAPLRVLMAGDVERRPDGASLPRVAPLDLATFPTDARQPNVPIGISARGPWHLPLARLGHTLIVGATGSGKSTWLHTALAVLFKQTTPAQLQVALIDPKRSELAIWANVPHRFGEIAHTPEEATKLLTMVVDEMNRRGDLIAGALCRDIGGYNQRAATPLPYLLIVIDECLDLVLAGTHTLANLLKSIAVRGRSAGVILWAATQHASAVEGLPRVVTVNLGSRLVFRVADANAARLAGCPGAHAIPRTIPGRMLAKIEGEPIAVQSFFLTEETLLTAAQSLAERVATPSRLGEQERALLRWAIEQGGGYLGLDDLMRIGHLGQREARRLAERMERAGWIVKDPQRKNKRRVCQAVVAGLLESETNTLTNATNSTN